MMRTPDSAKTIQKSKTSLKAGKKSDTKEDLCGKCKKKVLKDEPGIQCERCDKWYHTKCIEMSARVYDLLSTSEAEWKCTSCSVSQIKPGDTNGLIQLMLQKFTNLEVTITAVTDIIKEFNDLKACCEELKDRNQALEEKCSELSDEITLMKGELRLVNAETSRRAQYDLKNNLIITGIPEQKEEKLDKILLKLGSDLGVRINLNEVLAMHRLKENPYSKESGQPRELLVKFLRYPTKEAFLNKFKLKYRNNKRVLASETLVQGTNKVVALRDHLTPKNKFLYRKALRLRDEGKLHFAWIKKGEVLVKAKGKTHKIVDAEDLAKFREKLPPLEQQSNVHNVNDQNVDTNLKNCEKSETKESKPDDPNPPPAHSIETNQV
ncbi:unnamed protein product [Bemisia tabaci]|uniref:PHD-type domain-containing protein n=1 Tax=Bemisia tabaci TaxID=7038 RepID=A0A9P0F1S4_BEMTA|nr:unnamed protein product [Bemisia tabaci]